MALATLPWLVRRLEIIDGAPSAEFVGVLGIDPDDVLFLFPAALWAGWAQGLLLLAAFGGLAFTTALYVMHYRKFTTQYG